MSKPPEHQEAACCMNCEYFNYNGDHTCMKHGIMTLFSMICADYKEEFIKMLKGESNE